MNWKVFLFGSAGIIAGYTITKAISKQKNASPEIILKRVKHQFKKQGPIQGSWIHMEPQSYQKGPIPYRVFKGGISRSSSGKNEQFEFIADAVTGAVLDIQLISI